MASTFSQILPHYVFAVKGRESILRDDYREELHRYIAGILDKTPNKLLAIGSVDDHMHVLVGMHSSTAPSDLVRDIKSHSSRFIREKRFVKTEFAWQEGYGVFSHSNDEKETEIEYILHQREHHAKKPFETEFRQFLKRWGVPFDERYMFQWISEEQVR